MGSILTTTKVTKSFGGLVAVSEFDLEVEESSISSVIGPNGAGKTTFFNCVTGFYKVDGGQIDFNGHEIQGFSPDRVTRLGIARTYQNIRLFADMTAIENILVGQHPLLKTFWMESIVNSKRFRREEEEALQEANRLLHFVGLKGMGDLMARAGFGQQTQDSPSRRTDSWHES